MLVLGPAVAAKRMDGEWWWWKSVVCGVRWSVLVDSLHGMQDMRYG